MESEDRCHVMTFFLCFMALNNGMNGGVNMGQYMRNTMEANQSAYRQAHTEMVNSYANCYTVNPMGAKMCASCKNYDAQNYWCNLLEQPAASATMNGFACYRYKYWELNIDESLKKCCCETKQTPDDYFIKDCRSCKYDHNGWCNKFQRYCAIASGPKCLGGSGDCISHRYWEPKQERKKEMSKFSTIPNDMFCIEQNEVGTLIKKSDLETPKHQTQDVIIVDYGEDIDNCPKNIMTLKKVYEVDENGAWSAVGNAPEKKHLELSDLYSLAFPFDPIQEYFAGIYKQIDKEHAKRMEILERVKVKPGEHVEPVEVLDKPKEKSEALKDWIWKDWIWIERIIVIVVAITYAITAICCVLYGAGIFEATVACVSLFLEMSAMNTVIAFCEGR